MNIGALLFGDIAIKKLRLTRRNLGEMALHFRQRMLPFPLSAFFAARPWKNRREI
jgi:hypothetical protein